MNELNEALSLVHDLINAGGKDFAAWRLYRLERLLGTVRERYFFDESDVAILAPDDPLVDELVGELEKPFPAA